MNNRNLRFIFVQLLFSLAIGQVAIKVSDLIIGDYALESLYVYTHLALCVVILSTSWVGFQISVSSEGVLDSVFSVPFITLLLDISLVISYFIIVRGAEIINYPKTGEENVVAPDIHNETFWTVIIFTIYLLWDLVTKLFESTFEFDNSGVYVKKYPMRPKEFASRAWPTFLCVLLSLFIYWLSEKITPTKFNTVLIDFVLIFLFFLFRGFKQTMKKQYKLSKEKIPISNADESTEEKATIEDKRFKLKYFIAKILPSILLFICFLILYCCN
jgi:hypothetical protein